MGLKHLVGIMKLFQDNKEKLFARSAISKELVYADSTTTETLEYLLGTKQIKKVVTDKNQVFYIWDDD